MGHRATRCEHTESTVPKISCCCWNGLLGVLKADRHAGQIRSIGSIRPIRVPPFVGVANQATPHEPYPPRPDVPRITPGCGAFGFTRTDFAGIPTYT